MSPTSERPPPRQPPANHAGVQRNPEITASTLAAALRALGDRARRLPPADHRRPERWHEAREELGEDLHKLADQVAAEYRSERP